MKTNRFIIEYHDHPKRFYVDFEPYTRDKIALDKEGIVFWLDAWVLSLATKDKRKMNKIEEYEDYINYKIIKGLGLIEFAVAFQNVNDLIEEMWEDFVPFHTTLSGLDFERIPRSITWANMRAMRKYLQEIRAELEEYRCLQGSANE